MDIRIKKSIETINHIIDDLKFDNPKQFSDSLDFDRPERIYKVLRGQVSISRNLAEIINKKYPQYSIDWLLTGEGEITKGPEKKEMQANDEQSHYRKGNEDNYALLSEKIDAINDNVIALAEGTKKNFESMSLGLVQLMKNDMKLIQFVEKLDPEKIGEATLKLDAFMQRHENS
ncbi:hypothetical protein SAMN04487764_1542 [Gillisia sp. Hel1_33_143]|uniref:hypothetical protein n=1 Tax=Gillisia sp. Hel1_33_143 TaxID=1336796 RepID=UPI00087A430E|nr:hypothetical protein [Gillisia sp. Hel1_33_143]SDS14001.1 hypothetical protein SAMN04487764_1542 [Gillisia sp. Hel1_33_143]